MLALAIEAGIENLVIASSSSVYGNSTPLPAREDASAVVPESPYAASKRSAELVAAAMTRAAPRLSCTVLRLFTVMAPGSGRRWRSRCLLARSSPAPR